MNRTFAVAIGGAAGQGVATPGDIFAKIFARRGLHINAYNAYQSIIRGGHTFLTIRAGIEEVTCFGDRIDLLIDTGATRGGAPSTIVDVTGADPVLVWVVASRRSCDG